jgi:hypothetical protein
VVRVSERELTGEVEQSAAAAAAAETPSAPQGAAPAQPPAGGRVEVRRVRHERLGLVYYIWVRDLPDNLSPFFVFVWRCPHCGAEVHAWTPKQLHAAVRAHAAKHVDMTFEEVVGVG